MLRIGQPPACLEPSLRVVDHLGATVARPEPGVYELHGRGPRGLQAPGEALDVSGAPVLGAGLLGALSGQPFESQLGPFEASDAFTRDLEALRARGARVAFEGSWCRLGPLSGSLRGQQARFGTPSPMSKHLLLVSGLFADAATTIVEGLVSADHTERLLDALGATIECSAAAVRLTPGTTLPAFEFGAPGNPAMAAYLLAAGAVCPNSHVTVRDVLLNPTRAGFFEAFRSLGVGVGMMPKRQSLNEPAGEVSVKHRAFSGGKLGGEMMLRLDHEVHALAVVAAHAAGESQISDLEHLLSPADLAKMVGFLRSFGVQAEESSHGLCIVGTAGRPFQASRVTTGGDARLAAMGILLALGAKGESVIDDVEVLAEFSPRLLGTLRALGAQVEVQS